MKTLIVLIGNTDNKLTQQEWAEFCERVRQILRLYADQTQFVGFSPTDSPFQNACYVITLRDDAVESELIRFFRACCAIYRQDSICAMVAEPKFIGLNP